MSLPYASMMSHSGVWFEYLDHIWNGTYLYHIWNGTYSYHIWNNTYSYHIGNDRNFGSVRFGVRLILAGSVRFGKNFAEVFVIQFHAHLQYTGIKRTDYAILMQQIVFTVTAKFHNTYLDNSVLRCKTFGLLRGRILYSCFDFIVLAKLCMLRLRFFET